jgi:hypothetical protein
VKTYEVLDKALALIEDENNWAITAYGSASSGPWCAVGSVAAVLADSDEIEFNRIVDWNHPDPEAVCVLEGLARRECGATEKPLRSSQSIEHFNDDRPHHEVVALFQEAIRSEKAKAGVPVELPAPVAQMEEHSLCKGDAAGSIPAGGSLLDGGRG